MDRSPPKMRHAILRDKETQFPAPRGPATKPLPPTAKKVRRRAPPQSLLPRISRRGKRMSPSGNPLRLRLGQSHVREPRAMPLPAACRLLPLTKSDGERKDFQKT